MKNNGGFSLVELIVVIAIMAILAGVAVPTYSKYITKANDAKVVTQLDEVKTAAQAAGAAKGKTVTTITVATDGTVTAYVGTASDVVIATDIDDYIALTGAKYAITLTDTTYATGATWSSSTGKWEAGVKVPTA